LANLINKNADGIVNFMLDAYDCPEKYEYRTKHQGKDCVHRCCLNFAAGTTPDYMAKTFDDSLLNEGMASRSFFIFAYEKRFYKLETDAESETQLRAKSHLLAWLRKLSSLYGEVRLTEEAKQHLKFWYENIHPKVKPNRDPKMVHYYGRKDLHVLKTAMAIHFSDSLEMEISLETLIKAMDVLEEAEKKMHLALQVGSKNPLANIARKITAWFVARENEPASFKEILEVFYTDGKSSDIIEILQYMQSIQKMSRLPEDKAAKLPERYQLNPQTLAADKLETASDLPFIESRQTVHPSLADGIRWGRKGKIILKKGLPFEEIAKLRRLMSEGIVTGVTGLGWE
jgi:hypothetical protein